MLNPTSVLKKLFMICAKFEQYAQAWAPTPLLLNNEDVIIEVWIFRVLQKNILEVFKILIGLFVIERAFLYKELFQFKYALKLVSINNNELI